MQEQDKRKAVDATQESQACDASNPSDPLAPVWTRRKWVHEEALYAALAAREDAKKA